VEVADPRQSIPSGRRSHRRAHAPRNAAITSSGSWPPADPGSARTGRR
jgi:hypothetical protein